jgi:TorA maturation chaperone TorD
MTDDTFDERSSASGAPENATVAATKDAATYAVLSRCWRAPTAELVDALEQGALDDVVPGVADVDLEELRTAYTRLLVGPGEGQVPPYESVYRDGEPDDQHGPVLGPSTQAVEQWYRSYGLEPDEEYTDLPDHVATELEFLAYLAEHGERDACEQFLEEHVRQWLDEFLDAVSARTNHPFYEGLVVATRKVIFPDAG